MSDTAGTPPGTGTGTGSVRPDADGVPRPRRGQWRWPALAMFAVGYGANQFVPLLVVYRRDLGLSDAAATGVFGVYALGLIPGLLLGGPASDRYGRRRLMIGFAALSLLATAVLVTGRWGVAGLYAGRLLTGVVSGTVFTIGTAWVKELSGNAPGAGARRAALALTAGFGIGPLVAGVLAQWAPLPTVLPYLVHLVLGGVALGLLPRAGETRATAAGAARPRLRVWPRTASSARFRRVLLPMGPWVFGSVTLVFTTLPAHGVRPVHAVGVVFAGALAALALGAGLAGQRLGRWLQDSGEPGGPPRAAVTGLAVVTAGNVAAALAASRPGLLAVAAASLLLGCGYGLCLVAGLREIERLAAPDELGSTVAVFYSLAYAGLAIPFLLALAAPRTGYPAVLLLTGAASAATAVTVARRGRAGDRRAGSGPATTGGRRPVPAEEEP